MPFPGSESVFKEVLGTLRKYLSHEDILTREVDRRLYAYDAGTLWKHTPDLVVFPRSTRDVSEIMKVAYRHRIPVTPRGAGTNQSGGSIPIKGGIVLCFSRMNGIVDIDRENRTATVEPGVVLQDLNLALAARGLYFPPDPQSFFAATMGGIIAENAGGPVCVKYGVTKQYILAMTAVLPDGHVVVCGGHTMNNFFGYDLATLMIGSEGTLGLVTLAELRLLPLPEARYTVAAAFDNVRAAGEAVHKVISHGVIPAKSEFMDNWIVRKSEALSPVGFPPNAEAVILFETDGTKASALLEAETILKLCLEGGATWSHRARTPEEADKYWAARRAGFAAAFSSAPNILTEDIVVPIKQIPTLLAGIKEISEAHDVLTVVLGHAGDGNMHPDILTDRNNPEWFKRAEKALEEMIALAISLDGVISGEHGIGLEKKRYMAQSMDPAAISISKAIKNFFDPTGIMNPEKIWNN
jgi:glycolate dehydrogenase FAD-linked subunit